MFHKYYCFNHQLIIDDNLFAKNGLIFSKSRYSFNFIIKELFFQKKKKLKILFPSLFCYEVLYDFDFNVCDLVYYKIDDDLKPDFNSIDLIFNEIDDIDAIYVVDYFGIENNLKSIRERKDKHNVFVFFDKTHTILPNNKLLDNEFALFSFYKHIAISEGAGIYFNNISNLYNRSNYFLNDLIVEKYYQLMDNKYKKIVDIVWALKSIYVILIRRITYKPNSYCVEGFERSKFQKVESIRKSVTYFTYETINEFYCNTNLLKSSLYRTFHFYEMIYKIVNVRYKCFVLNSEFKNSHLFSIKFIKQTDSELVLSILQNYKLPIVIWPEKKYINSFENEIDVESIKRNIDSTIHLCVFAYNNLTKSKEKEILTKLNHEFN